MMTGEDSVAHVQDQREPDELRSCLLEIGSSNEERRSICESTLESSLSLTIQIMFDILLEFCEGITSRKRRFDSRFEEYTLDRPVRVVKNKNGHKWNMTEDEYHLWVSLDEKTTDLLIQKCPQKAEVVRMLRSESQKDKATDSPSSSIAPGPSNSSPGNCVAESFVLEAATFTSVAENNKSPPDNHKGIYKLENTSILGSQISSCGNPSVQYKPNFTVAEEPEENWLAVRQQPEEIITKESQWNKTEDNDLSEHLYKETTDKLIQKCPGKAEVDRKLRSEALKGKAAVPLSFITEERTLSTASRKQSANPIPDQTSLGGNQVHNQQVDPEDGSVNFAPSNQRNNYAAVSLDLDTATFTSITEKNEPSPVNQKSKYDVENTSMVGDQIISTAGSVWAKESSYDMSHNAESLWYFLSVSILVSFISCFDGLLLFGHKPRGMVARLLLCIAYVAIAFAVLATSGLQLPDELRVWITGGACVVSLPAIVGYAMKYPEN